MSWPGRAPADDSRPPPNLAWNGERALFDIAAQISFGSRSLDASGHQKEIEYIERELAKASAKVEEQHWIYTSVDGKAHALTNVIAHFGLMNSRRIILGTHYDSIVRAYRDPENPQGPMPGANNSASGVALLLETARVLHASAPPPTVGVDMIFFDGEEGPLSLGAGDPNWRALGSPYFVTHLPTLYAQSKPEAGVVFDMVCYKAIKLKPETYSLDVAKPQLEKFWKIGEQVAPSIFVSELTGYPISDDQIALSQAGIPSFLVIGFEYEPWFNTTKDTIDKCSAQVLEGLGKTVLSFLYAS